jgi:hypothetical protein
MAEDSLALLLEKAATNPGLRADFRKAFLAATVYVMGEIEGEDPAKRPEVMLKPGSKVVLRSQRNPDGRTFVPFFSSLEKLRGFIQGDDKVNYLAISSMMLFDLAKESTLVLNPGSRVRGEFTAADIAKIIEMETGAAPTSRKPTRKQ